MSHCAVNGQEYEAPAGLKTWGQLLESLEQGSGTERAVVTAVRFAGVDQPSFRDPVLLGQDLTAGDPIEVDTCRTGALLNEAVAAALHGLTPLADAARQTADAFRSHDLDDAHTRLAEVVVTLQALTGLTAAVHSSGLTPTSLRPDDSTRLLQQLGQVLEVLVTAATNEDWTSVADVLEYDLADLLPSWQAVLRALASPDAWADAGPGFPVTLRCAS